MKKILGYLKNLKGRCLAAGLITIFLLGIQIGIPLFTRAVLNEIGFTMSFQVFAGSLVIYAILLLIYNFIDVCWYTSLNYLGGELLRMMRIDLMQSLFYAPYKEVMQYGFEKIKNILYTDTMTIYGSLTVQLVNIISNGIMLIIFLVLSFFVDLRLGLVLFAVAAISFLISIFTRKIITGSSGRVNLMMKKNNKVLNEYVDSLETARNNNLLDYFEQKEWEVNQEFIGEAIRSDKFLTALKNVTKHFHQWASFLISALLILVIEVESGDLVYALLVLDIVLGASEGIESGIYQLMKTKPSYEHVNAIHAMRQPQGQETMEDVQEIRLSNVSFGYGSNQEKILKEYSEVFQKGDIIHVKGGNGSGKTTLLKLIKTLLLPDSGEIFFDGKNIKDLDTQCIHKLILDVSQDEILLNENFIDYLRIMTEETVSKEEMKQILDELSVDTEHGKIENLGLSLSGGQRKKLLFAKLMLKEKTAPIIMIDELENAMDLQTRELLEEYKRYLYEHRENHIVFVISHEEGQGEFYTRAINL